MEYRDSITDTVTDWIWNEREGKNAEAVRYIFYECFYVFLYLYVFLNLMDYLIKIEK